MLSAAHQRLSLCLAALAGCACAAAALAQPLLSNASPDASVPALALAGATFSGASPPSGSLWSEVAAPSVFEGNALAGAACHLDTSGGMRLADDFTLTQGISVSGVWVYAYAPAGGPLASPVSGATLRIWQGTPGAPGSSVVAGDITTNRLVGSTFAGAYRVFGTETGPVITPPTSDRAIWRLELALNVTLPPGTYWLDWQVTPAFSGGSVFSPLATIADSRGLAGWNASQQSAGVWRPILDQGKPASAADVPQDLPFVVLGTSACASVDFNGDGVFPDEADIIDYLLVLGGGACPTGTCGDLDFNGDGVFPDEADFAAFLRVLGGGTC